MLSPNSIIKCLVTHVCVRCYDVHLHAEHICVDCRWTIAEARECLEEAGFKKVCVWMRTMPDLQSRENEEDEIDVDENSKYEETNRFLQCDSWNAYVVGVA